MAKLIGNYFQKMCLNKQKLEKKGDDLKISLTLSQADIAVITVSL